MQSQSIPPLVAGSLTFAPGAFAFFLYLRCRRRADLSFALTCAAIAGYDCVTAALYDAATPIQGVFWQRWQMVALAWIAISMTQHTADCFGTISGRVKTAITAYFAMVATLEALGDFGLLFTADRPYAHTVRLPWGSQVTYQEAQGGPFFLVHCAIGFMAFAYAFFAAYRAYRRGDRRTAPAMMVSLTVFAASEINDSCVSFGLYSFVYTLEYSWLGIVLTAFYTVADELVEAGIVKAERHQLEEQLRQAAQMEAIGRLAAGVAHDLNNQLTPIIGYSDIALMREPLSEGVRRYFGHIRDAAEHARELAQQLLAFGRKQVVTLTVLDPNEVVRASRRMIERMAPENITVKFRLESAQSRVRADATQLRQILFNLILNARDAMPNGGELEISTASRVIDESSSASMAGLPPGRYVALSVHDTGIGIDPATQARIFEPFFTTKDLSTNSGLGLPSVCAIVKQHAGGIRVESAPGRGALFEICLPAVNDPTSLLPNGATEIARSRGGAATVLLVEDEDSVRNLASSILTEHGFVVLEAATPKRALDCALEHGEKIQLLLTDVVMPEMTGPELYEQLRVRFPKLPVVYMSGYAQSLIGPGSGTGRMTFVAKPFSPAELLKAVDAILFGPPADEPRLSAGIAVT